MTAPSGLDTEGKRAYANAVAAIVALGYRAEDYEDAIVRYARSTDLVATLRRDWQALGSPVLAPGGAGQPRPHPLPGEIRDAEAHSAALGDALLLSPMARAKAGRARGGRPQGASQAPDRQARGLRVAT
jgi:hypothetical protein